MLGSFLISIAAPNSLEDCYIRNVIINLYCTVLGIVKDLNTDCLDSYNSMASFSGNLAVCNPASLRDKEVVNFI